VFTLVNHLKKTKQTNPSFSKVSSFFITG